MRRGTRRSPADPAGFSLVELMVAIVLLSAVVGTVMSMLMNVQRSWSVSRDQMVSQQNERAGVELMVRDIRMAGTGFAGRPLTTGGVPHHVIYPLEPRPGTGSGDTLIVTAGFSGVRSSTSAAMGSPSDALKVASVTGFSLNDLVVVTNGVEANMFQVTAVDGNTNTLGHSESSPYNLAADHTLWPAQGYPVGSTVAQVGRVFYWVDDTGTVPKLRRQRGGETPLTVAANVTGMRFRYLCADGSLSSSPSDPSLIRSVLLEYLSPAAGGGSEGGDSDTLSVRIQPRVLG